jgi:hypothetical protein
MPHRIAPIRQTVAENTDVLLLLLLLFLLLFLLLRCRSRSRTSVFG